MKHRVRWTLLIYDMLLYLLSAFFILIVYPSSIDHLTPSLVLGHIIYGFLCIFVCRFFLKVYEQIWRYAGPTEYIRLMAADTFGGLIFVFMRKSVFSQSVTFVRAVSIVTLNLLACIAMRHLYQWIYQRRSKNDWLEKTLLILLKYTTGTVFSDEKPNNNRIKVAIIGAGSVGAMLADDLLRNSKSIYEPVCFVDIDRGKLGREIYGIPVLDGDSSNLAKTLENCGVQEVVFALPNATTERRTYLYEYYKNLGYKIKAYDYPTLNSDEGSKRQIHDFDIEDLLFRGANECLSEETIAWYRGKNVLITGGGGSIGSELARQIARCNPSRLIILDVYENGAYDLQQELKIRYGDTLNLLVEIVSVCDRASIEKIFKEHVPDIVLHAAAHKHVPLMERNVCEAVSNNVFGTLNVVECCEKYGVARFIMISTDKAVNPTNVMGATKRMCEMIVQSRKSNTSFSATRFGNVLGSNGSVIPLFKRQIAAGGPVTVTDKRIIRYFMTIPEAAQLVMTSGAMSKNGELYVLDMGKPVKILTLAENMIRLSGLEPYKDIDIVEMGLRPGEKLYEELLIKTETLDKTDNDLIYIERDVPLAEDEINRRLDLLKTALATQNNQIVRETLMKVVPTYHTPQEVNEKAIEAEEMRQAGM